MHLRGWSVIAIVGTAFLGCTKGARQNATDGGPIGIIADGGDDAGPDSGPVGGDHDSGSPADLDSGPVSDVDPCAPVPSPPSSSEGGISQVAVSAPTTVPPQDAGWISVSDDPECQSIHPEPVPSSLSWSLDAGMPACSAPAVNDTGDLAIIWGDGALGVRTSFLPSDVNKAPSTWANGAIGSPHKEDELAIAPSSTGFAMISQTFNPWCSFTRNLTSSGTITSIAGLDVPDPNRAIQIARNPAGGYVVVRLTTVGSQQPFTQILETEYLDDSLHAVSDWQSAIVYHKPSDDSWPGLNVSDVIYVNSYGHALVLAFAFPPSYGPPPPPSEWRFFARWMGPTGPISDVFEPAAPVLTPADGTSPLFAGWGTVARMPGGGFATFRYPAGAGDAGPIVPSGWYALYQDGQTGFATTPDWLNAYDGTLQAISGANAFASISMNDPKTCARTINLIAATGKTCFVLNLADTASTCSGYPDLINTDGTFVIHSAISSRNNCAFRWWPKVVSVSSSNP